MIIYLKSQYTFFNGNMVFSFEEGKKKKEKHGKPGAKEIGKSYSFFFIFSVSFLKNE